MTQSQHTPGPWIITSKTYDAPELKSGRFTIWSVNGHTVGLDEEGETNARLIAAAPDLLELLTLALPYVEEGEEFNKPNARKLSKDIRAAIQKAGV